MITSLPTFPGGRSSFFISCDTCHHNVEGEKIGMLVICNGMPRSASTWSFAVVMELLRRYKPQEEVHGNYDANVAHFLETAAVTASHLVLKSHLLDDVGRSLARVHAARVIYTWREPMDAVASSMEMFGYGFEHSFALVRDSLELLRIHRHTGNATVLSYKQIVHRPIVATELIASYLGLSDHVEIVRQVAEDMSLAQMIKKLERQGAISDKDRPNHLGLDILQQNEFEWNSLLLHHIRHGGMGYGVERLSTQQAETRERSESEIRASGGLSDRPDFLINSIQIASGVEDVAVDGTCPKLFNERLC